MGRCSAFVEEDGMEPYVIVLLLGVVIGMVMGVSISRPTIHH